MKIELTGIDVAGVHIYMYHYRIRIVILTLVKANATPCTTCISSAKDETFASHIGVVYSQFSVQCQQ